MVLSTMPSGTREKSKDGRDITISRNRYSYSLPSLLLEDGCSWIEIDIVIV